MRDAKIAQLKELDDLNDGLVFVVGDLESFMGPFPDLRVEVERYVEELKRVED